MKKAISFLISGIITTSSMPLATFAAEAQPSDVSEIDSTASDNNNELKKELTLEDVDNLSQKGYELTVKDFDNYNYHDTGEDVLSGINREYIIDEEYSLVVIDKDSDVETAPESIVLFSNKGFAADIRSSEYQDFFATPIMYLITEMPDAEYTAYINVILDNGSLYWCQIEKAYADTIVDPSEYTDDRAKSPRGFAKKDLKLNDDMLGSIKAVGKEIAENSNQNELVECTKYTITSERERLFLVNDGKSYAAADFGENCKMINNENVQKLIAELVATGYSETVSAVDEKNGISGSYSENITWTLDADGVLTLSGEGEIPDLTESAPWSSRRADIQTIIVEDGITSIGKDVFIGLEDLTSVSLPKGIKSISDNAFYKCINLKTINFPDGLERIGSDAFFGCQLESIALPESLTEIGERAFYNCRFTSAIIPDNVNSLGECAFSYCTELENITIPDTVSNIDGAFTHCKKLKEVKIPSSVEKIREDTFFACIQLETIIFMNPDTIICDENGDEIKTFFTSFEEGVFKGVIRGYKGSKAEEYAIKYNTSFETLISEKSGDSNGDGRIDMSDAVLIMQTIANPSKYKLNEQGSKNADMDGDGVTNADALAIQKKLLKLE
ncbi:MAG: leucine-rich repeat protein [Clostridia bacterium]|nr:leucine-rich repeat protein [Clostridia bacterium]